MKFKDAFRLMKMENKKIKLPNCDYYLYWNKDKKTIAEVHKDHIHYFSESEMEFVLNLIDSEQWEEFKGEEKMKKAMLSQPMNGKTEEEIVETRERAIKNLTEKGYEVINTCFTDEWYSKENMEKCGVVQIPLRFLAKSLENMSLCHTAYFCKGWEDARGCKIEHEVAKAYDLEIIYEE